jgi:hypothetical protein
MQINTFECDEARGKRKGEGNQSCGFARHAKKSSEYVMAIQVDRVPRAALSRDQHDIAPKRLKAD